MTQLESTFTQATQDKEASTAGAERTYDQTVASLDAQYGSESSNHDTGVEGAIRRSAIATIGRLRSPLRGRKTNAKAFGAWDQTERPVGKREARWYFYAISTLNRESIS